MYKTIPQSVKASFWFALIIIVQKGIMFLVTPVYTRLLSTDEYGYYSIFSSWLNILSVTATLNLSGGVFNNGMLKFETDRDRYISSMQGLGGTCTIITFFFIFAFSHFIMDFSGLNIYVLTGMFLYLLFNPCYSYWSMYQRYIYKYKMLVFTTLTVSIAVPAVSIGLIYLLTEKKYAIVVGTIIVQTGIGILFFIKNWLKGRKLYVAEYWKFAIKFNLPLLPHYLAGIVLGQSDRIMIQNMAGQDKAGIYSLAYSISLMANIIITGINASFVPWTYQRVKDEDYKRIGEVTNYILLLLGTIVSLGVLIGPEIIRILGTPEYMEAQWIIAPVMLSTFYMMLYTLFANLEFYYEKTTFIMLASCIAAVANIILNYICIPIFGFIAAGYTTMACYLLFAIMHYVFMCRICRQEKIDKLYDKKFIWLFTLGLSIVSLLLMLTYRFVFIRYSFVVIIAVVCFKFRNKIFSLLYGIRKR